MLTGLAEAVGPAVAAAADGPERRLAALTAREREIAELVADGLTSPAIANDSASAAARVETHLSRVYRKTGVSSRAALAGLMAGRTPRPSLKRMSHARFEPRMTGPVHQPQVTSQQARTVTDLAFSPRDGTGHGSGPAAHPGTPRWAKAYGIAAGTALLVAFLLCTRSAAGWAAADRQDHEPPPPQVRARHARHVLGRPAGAVAVLLACAVVGLTSQRTQTVRSAHLAMELTGPVRPWSR